jgi:DNA polymerase III delta subunit
MNTYEFEYDTLSRMNQKCTYQATSLTEALSRFKRNHAKTHIGKLLSFKENGKNIMDAIFSVFSAITM